MVGEDEGVVWAAKQAKQTVIPEAATAQAKAETKTVRPDVRAYYPIYSDTVVHGKLISFLYPILIKP